MATNDSFFDSFVLFVSFVVNDGPLPLAQSLGCGTTVANQAVNGSDRSAYSYSTPSPIRLAHNVRDVIIKSRDGSHGQGGARRKKRF